MPNLKPVSCQVEALAEKLSRSQACTPEVAQRHSGYLVGGTSPFGTRKAMPVYVEASVLLLPRVCVNGGRRGFLVGLAPSAFTALLGARAVNCAL